MYKIRKLKRGGFPGEQLLSAGGRDGVGVKKPAQAWDGGSKPQRRLETNTLRLQERREWDRRGE